MLRWRLRLLYTRARSSLETHDHLPSITMDVQLVQNLLADTQASLQAFQQNGSDISRIEAHEKAVNLARALEQPRDAILKLSFSVCLIYTMSGSLSN